MSRSISEADEAIAYGMASGDDYEAVARNRRVPPAFAASHDAYERERANVAYKQANASTNAATPPQRVSELDAFITLLRAERAKVREANSRLSDMRGRLFGEPVGNLTTGASESPAQPTISEIRDLFEQMHAETEELLDHISRLEDLA